MTDSPGQITRLLTAWGSGEREALGPLYQLVYDELHRLGHGRMRHERRGHTLQTTALVHEAFLRMADQQKGSWESRGQFFALAARTMRRILVDHARRRQGLKRGGDAPQLSLEDAGPVAARADAEVLSLHDALKDLAALDPRKAKMVELRYFGGLGIEETARCLGVSPGTVMRDWTLAKAWIKRQVRPSRPMRVAS